MSELSIEAGIGLRCARRRETLGLSQSQLGRAVGLSLGQDWPRQAVSAAENGRRAFRAAELLAFADALEVDPADLFPKRAGKRDATESDVRRDAAGRLRHAALVAGPDPLLVAVLTALATEIQPGPADAIDIDGSGYMLDQRALRIAEAFLGESR